MVPSLLELAQDGDGDAFAQLVAPHRLELHRYCYRMLGSLTDADDLCQETMLVAWRAIGGFCGRSSLRTWLYRIATNRCLNAIRDQKRRPPPVPVPPFDPVGAENPICPAQATIRYSWMRPPSRSVLRSLAASTSLMVRGAASESAGGRCLRDRCGRCAL